MKLTTGEILQGKQWLDKILNKVDRLGFDYNSGAKRAILEHSDWSSRWDVVELTNDEIEAVDMWRIAYLN